MRPLFCLTTGRELHFKSAMLRGNAWVASLNDLRILYQKLEPNGGIFLDLVNRDFFLGHPVIDRWLYDDGTAILESAELDYASSLLRTKRKYVSIK